MCATIIKMENMDKYKLRVVCMRACVSAHAPMVIGKSHHTGCEIIKNIKCHNNGCSGVVTLLAQLLKQMKLMDVV